MVSNRRRHTRYWRDWSSDVCSSDLGIGKSAGATLTVIAEEFPKDEPVRLGHLVDILETAMLKRVAHGRPFGVAVLAEGIGLRLAPRSEERRVGKESRSGAASDGLKQKTAYEILA